MRPVGVGASIAMVLMMSGAAVAGSDDCRYPSYSFSSYENSTTRVAVTVKAGAVCGVTLGSTWDDRVESTVIAVRPRHGEAMARGLYVVYRSQPKYRGPDRLDYVRTLTDRSGRRYTSRVEMNFTVVP